MADFLASFNFSSEAPAPLQRGLGSIEELQSSLRDTLSLKVTETRAEHVSITEELKSSVELALAVSEGDNEALQSLSNLDPSLGGLRATGVSVDPSGQTLRVVKAQDALMNQNDNPVLQRTVAKHIIAAVSVADGSNWVLRDMSRVKQDWTFTYLCKDSLQQWNRQNSKNPGTAVVGEYSLKEPDPVLMARPAFDCRGSITITFARSSRTIKIKYDHTPIHRTVAQLSEHYPPRERQFGPGYQRQQQKTPKKSSSEKRKKRKERADEGGEQGGAAQTGELGAEGEPKPKKKRKMPKPKNKGSAAIPGNAETLQAGSANAAAPGFGELSQSAAAAAALPFNVTPEEAARRLEHARKVLSEAGVNPDTLSTDQMHIFSNQSPELQKDSVAMLAKYGAERLQIVHPANKGQPVTEASSQSAGPSTEATPTGPMTTKELLPSGKEAKKTSKSTAKVAQGVEGEHLDVPQPSRKRGPGRTKSRVACFTCKGRKVKCPKQWPKCSECDEAGLTCEFPPPKPKRNRRQSEAVDAEGSDDPAEEGEDDEQEQQEPSGNVYQPQGPYHLGPNGSSTQDNSYPQMPVANLLTPSVDNTTQAMHASQDDYFSQHPNPGMPQPDMARIPHHGSDLSNPISAVQPEQQMVKPASPKTARKQGGPRRSLPNGTSRGARQQASQDSNKTNMDSSGWVPTIHTPVPLPVTNQYSPTLAQQQAAATARNQRLSTNSPQLNESVPQSSSVAAQAAALQQAQQAQQSPPNMVAAMQAQARVVSPFQAGNAQKTTSRQAQRAQSRTPNTDQPESGLRPPAIRDGYSQNQNDGLVATSAYNHYNHYATAAEATGGNDRISYQPYSQRTTASETPTYPAYDYTRTTSSSRLPQTAVTTASSYNATAATAGQWSGSQVRNRSSRTGAYNPLDSYNPDSGMDNNASTALQNFNIRSSTQDGSSSGASGSKQPQSYPHYPANSSSQQQQPTQAQQPMGQGWYNFNHANGGSFPSGNSNSNYSYGPWAS